MKTAINSVRQHLGILIQNQNTAKSYAQTEEVQQAIQINHMRIEAGITFLYTNYAA